MVRRVGYDPRILIEARERQNLTQRKAAKIAGIHYVTLCNIEKGCATSEDSIEPLCRLYGLDMNDLIFHAPGLAEDAKKFPEKLV